MSVAVGMQELRFRSLLLRSCSDSRLPRLELRRIELDTAVADAAQQVSVPEAPVAQLLVDFTPSDSLALIVLLLPVGFALQQTVIDDFAGTLVSALGKVARGFQQHSFVTTRAVFGANKSPRLCARRPVSRNPVAHAVAVHHKQRSGELLPHLHCAKLSCKASTQHGSP